MDRGLGHCTGGGDQDHPHEKEMQKGKMVAKRQKKKKKKKGILKNAEMPLRRPYKYMRKEKKKAKNEGKDIPN